VEKKADKGKFKNTLEGLFCCITVSRLKKEVVTTKNLKTRIFKRLSRCGAEKK